MHRTYSMRSSRAPTASEIQNPPPPRSSTKSGRLLGKANIGEHNPIPTFAFDGRSSASLSVAPSVSMSSLYQTDGATAPTQRLRRKNSRASSSVVYRESEGPGGVRMHRRGVKSEGAAGYESRATTLWERDEQHQIDEDPLRYCEKRYFESALPTPHANTLQAEQNPDSYLNDEAIRTAEAAVDDILAGVQTSPPSSFVRRKRKRAKSWGGWTGKVGSWRVSCVWSRKYVH